MLGQLSYIIKELINFLFSLPGKPTALYDETSPDWASILNIGHSKRKEPDHGRHQRKISRLSKEKDQDAAADLLRRDISSLRRHNHRLLTENIKLFALLYM